VDEVSRIHDPAGLVVSRAAFRRHVECLQRWGYRFETFGGVASAVGEGRGDGCVALTFDDGFESNRTVLLPLLQHYGIRATCFVVSSWLGGLHLDAPTQRILDADGVRALRDAGIEIGAHTRTHADLGEASEDESREEFAVAKRDLEAILDEPVDLAAYPYGRASVAAVAGCRAAGFRAACRTSGQGSWDDPWNLPRQDMGPGATRIGLRLKRDDLYEPLMTHRAARAVRRVVRILSRHEGRAARY
jgi:peptidoglycan/xylan/chitin deacetylase (PgdA/CDA1 family)